jgi:tetratricopeptide (TPR) repeat protein
MARSLGFLLCFAGVIGCQSATPKPAGDATDTTPGVHMLDPVVVHARGADDLMAELERGRSLLLVEQYPEAAETLDRLFAQADDPALRALAAYNAGLAYEGLGNREAALDRYRTVSDKFAAQGIAKNALVRETRVLGYLERWPELQRAAGNLLARGNLPVMDAIEGHGAKALALVEQGEIDGARIEVGKAGELIDKNGFGRAGQPPVQLAQVSFAEGELRRIKSEAITLVPVPPNFTEVLEARCQGLLDAQSAYSEAMRARDAHWSAMSGYRVGQLYTQLHAEAMSIPAPANADTAEKKQKFEGAMRLRYRILLEKGLKMMDATVRLGDRTGEDSEWVARAREAKRQLDQALADEKAALAKMPFTEDELRAALEKLKARAAQKP